MVKTGQLRKMCVRLGVLFTNCIETLAASVESDVQNRVFSVISQCDPQLFQS